MTEIIEAIDAWTLGRYGIYTEKLFGFCELMRKSAGGTEQPIPVTIPDRLPVAIDDRYNFITWIRWTAPVSYEANSEFSFGKEEARQGNLPLRIILAHKTTLGEDLVFDFMNAFPSKFNVPGFQFVFSEASPTIDPDHETIYTTELGNTTYEKHRFTWNIYVLNVTMQFLECEELTP
jgi:hypothetical protein